MNFVPSGRSLEEEIEWREDKKEAKRQKEWERQRSVQKGLGQEVASFYASLVQDNDKARSNGQARDTGKKKEKCGTKEETKRCEICKVDVSTSDWAQHLSSTAHNIEKQMKEPIPVQYGLPPSNVGYKLLVDKMKWDDTKGLGVREQGRHYPVKTVLKLDKAGLGAATGPGQGVARVTHSEADRLEAERRKQQEQRFKTIRSGQLTRRQRRFKESREKRKDQAIREAVYRDWSILKGEL